MMYRWININIRNEIEMANIISKIKLSNNGDTKIYNIADKDDREALSDLNGDNGDIWIKYFV